MPAKLLSCSFLRLSLAWYSLARAHSLFLFVSLSLTFPYLCCFFFFCFIRIFLTSSTSLHTSLHLFLLLIFLLTFLSFLYAISVFAACWELYCCNWWLWVRGEEHGQAKAAIQTAPNKAAFTQVPRPRHLCEDLHWLLLFPTTLPYITRSCFTTAVLCPPEIVFVKEETTALQPLAHSRERKFPPIAG